MPSFVAALFFKAGIDVSLPAILLINVGPGQHATRALHGEARTMEQLAHMAWMIMNAEFLLDHPGDHRRSPDARTQTVSYRATIENVVELFPLRRRQLPGRPERCPSSSPSRPKA